MKRKKQHSLKYWQWRILITMILGYALFYLTRQNLSIAMPMLESSEGFTKQHIGWIFTSFSVVYGVGKFVNGFVTDRGSAKLIFAIGLIGSAVVSIMFAAWPVVFGFVVLAAISAWFQSMGWPPVAKLITRWYPSSELGSKWGMTNVSHQVGSVIILAGGPYLMTSYGWRSIFIIPGIIVLLGGVLVFKAISNRPEDEGFPAIIDEKNDDDASALSPKEIFMTHILPNKYVWYVCLSTFFLYIVRMGFFFWAPMFLKEVKGVTLIQAGWVTAGFEIAGAIGGVAAGYISDRWFAHRRGLIGTLYMVALILFLIYFWTTSGQHLYALTTSTFFVGFFVYGSQVITGVLAADVVSKKVVSSAVGLTGTFGYLASSIFSGVVIGHISHHYGWDVCFLFFVISAFLGAIFFFLTYSHK
ncbi:MAG: MFS transporter [Alphaproteobacteria bacterium]|nr:MFS transporter [Alphaproteobacteria bacterium]